MLLYSAAISESRFEFQVCKIVPRQRYQKKLYGSQFQPEPKQSIPQVHDITALCELLSNISLVIWT
jgi:hypothetical protein